MRRAHAARSSTRITEALRFETHFGAHLQLADLIGQHRDLVFVEQQGLELLQLPDSTDTWPTRLSFAERMDMIVKQRR